MREFRDLDRGSPTPNPGAGNPIYLSNEPNLST